MRDNPSTSPLFTCQQCGIVYKRFGSNPGKFCSLICTGAARARPVAERFWENVDTSGECWPWTGRTADNGYGRLKVGKREFATNRLSWEMVAGPIPDGFFALHVCDNPPCVRNDDIGIYVVAGIEHPRRGHLWLGTTQDNALDASEKGRLSAGDRHWARTRPETLSRGAAHGNAKLTEADVLDIRRRRSEGRKILASAFGISEVAVSQIVLRRSWKHI